jgi:hypothetical protein
MRFVRLVWQQILIPHLDPLPFEKGEADLFSYVIPSEVEESLTVSVDSAGNFGNI